MFVEIVQFNWEPLKTRKCLDYAVGSLGNWIVNNSLTPLIVLNRQSTTFPGKMTFKTSGKGNMCYFTDTAILDQSTPGLDFCWPLTWERNMFNKEGMLRSFYLMLIDNLYVQTSAIYSGHRIHLLIL